MAWCYVSTHQVKVGLSVRGVGAELVVNARLLHGFLQIVVEEKSMEDNLETIEQEHSEV